MNDVRPPVNPWLGIPLADYEAHMALPQVAQAALLAGVFGAFLRDLAPGSVAVVGCAGGNGLEQVDPAVTARVVAIDLNPGFAAAARARFAATFVRFEAVVADVAAGIPVAALGGPVALAWAALLFEYVEPAAALRQLAALVQPGGVLATLVQEPSGGQPAVSPSPYVSLAPLGPFLRHIAPPALAAAASAAGFTEVAERRVVTAGAKRFTVQAFRREANDRQVT